MLQRLALRDFVIVPALDLEFDAGFTVLTGETGAGKSILIDALQLALGGRGEALVVREGAPRAEISAEFDAVPPALVPWLAEAGFDAGGDDGGTLLLRRVIDAQGKSRAWINGSAATVAQLREAGEHLLDIHGQHAWQSLMRPAAVRALLDAQAGLDTAPLAAAWARRKAAEAALADARARQASLGEERDRLAWQIGELDKLAPGADEWATLNAEHQRAAHAQALQDAARSALDALADGEPHNAGALVQRAIDALAAGTRHDTQLDAPLEVLRGAQAQIDDAAHTLNAYLGRIEVDGRRLEALDARLGAWVALARRQRRAPEELPALLERWREELRTLDAASDLGALERALADASAAYDAEAARVSAARRAAAPRLGAAVSAAMQPLGMAGGRFEVALLPLDAPQAWGRESVELRVAAHAGATPRALAKVASGGELSRLALAVAVTTAAADRAGVPTLIFDEVDAGVGGSVAHAVGRLMKQLGRERQVFAVTHLAQVAACADQHCVVTKASEGGATTSRVRPVRGEARVAEVARMLGGERLATSLAHAQELLSLAAPPEAPLARTPARRKSSA
jgi:DNA repair protein RecN (Recombination protein N)